MPAHAFCSPQKVSRCALGRSPGLEGEEVHFFRPLHLPRSTTTEWYVEATRPYSQWRNRAGLAPDFPVMPDMGTKGEMTLTQVRIYLVLGLTAHTAR
jgi:hypothetical protein